MKQLSGTDTMFLEFERGNNYMHVASLAIYDPSTAPGGGVRFKDVLRHFTSRLEQFPMFRRRLVRVPLSLDRPYWVEDAAIDVEYHVRHIALPYPGDWRQLCIQVARIHSRPLDRTKPLWEAYVIEGLHNVKGVPPGSFALYTKMHHAIVDGESGTEIMKALLSVSPEPPEVEEQLPTRHAADRKPTAIELYSRAVVNNAQRLPTLGRFSFDTARRLASVAADAVGAIREQVGTVNEALGALLSGDLGALLPRLPPQTRFTKNVSAHRVFEAVELPLADFRAIRHQVGEGTINDLFLTIVGGALRDYLSEKGELPDESMVAMVPMTLRGDDKGGDRGNQVAGSLMRVHTDIADPVKRLRAIRESAAASKRLSEKLGKELMRDLLDNMPQFIVSPVAHYAKLPKLGLVVSNVRGPDVPLYLAGARLVNYAPISIVVDGTGLNVTGFSYAGSMWICAVSCREMLPDPAHFADCLRNAFATLKEAAHREAAAAKRAPPTKPARKKAAKRVRAARTPRGATRHRRGGEAAQRA